jgi:hypothetical protein
VKCHAKTNRRTGCRRVALTGPLCLTHHDMATKNGGELPEKFAPDPDYNEQEDPAFIAPMEAAPAAEKDEKTNKKGTDQRCLSTTNKGRRCTFLAYQDFSFCKRHLTHMNIPHDNDSQVTVTEKSPAERKSCPVRDSIETPTRGMASKSPGADNASQRTVTGASEPVKDRCYREGQGMILCEATTIRKNPCQYATVGDTPFCYMHEDFDLKRPHVPRSATKRMNAEVKDADESLGSSSSSLGEGEERAASDDPSIEDNRSVAKSSAPKDSDNSSMEGSENESDGTDPNIPYTHTEFLEMWRNCEEFCGEMTEDIENTRLIRGANNKMAPEDSDGQLKAQYGRLLPTAMRVSYSAYQNMRRSFGK